MEIKEISFMGYPSSDIPRSRKFYEEVLKLTPAMAESFTCPETGLNRWWIEYEIGGVALALTDVWPPSAQSGPTVALEVDDLDAWFSALQEKGIPFVFDIQASPVCRFFCIQDPDGNALMLHQRNENCGCCS